MKALALAVRTISAFNTAIGKTFSWLSLGIVLVCFSVVVLRYFLNTGFVWLQDLYVWMNGIMFTGIAGYVLLREGHVRVDIFYRPATVRRKAIIDLIGTFVFLLPFAWVVTYYSWNYVMSSWSIAEQSSNAGGLHGLYVLKSFILVFAAVIALQGLAIAMRSLLVLADKEDLLPEDLRYKVEG
ncbi:TRAP transporter small permease subunit [Ferrovibrio sp.]|uniref:TRAP transporter small permease subunit n=1 Tax=Ferrovibrio sp. TaxID=1917215 RepID=UPI0025C4B8B6|nr:TRAP transporter small permease subunit [Ferrovibrio sp.]